jgi:hypothetical protein
MRNNCFMRMSARMTVPRPVGAHMPQARSIPNVRQNIGFETNAHSVTLEATAQE